MKFHFNERQRFSLRKYSFGLASVLLGTAFFLSGQVASADESKVSETVPSSVLSANPDSSNSTSESSAPETADSKPTVADKPVVTPETTEVSSDSEKVATENPKSEKSEASAKESSEETAKATEVKAEVAEKDDKSTDKAPAEVAEKDDKSTDKAPAPAEARRSTRTRRATSENKREVSNWSEFVSALEDGNVNEITVNGDVVATGDNGNTDNGRPGSVDRKTTINAPSRPVTIQGKNENARLELLSHTLELTGASWELNLKNLKIATANSKGPIDLSRTSGSNTVTFENVTSVGSSLYGGGGNTNVVIKGNTTSTVSDSYQAANGQTQHVQRNVGAAGRSDQRRESNIHDAKSVTVAEGASLTLNRSSQGDAITLESGAKVSVKDKGSLTINMNTDNRTDNARYHNAGIFMADSGTVETGKGSKLVLNTSIGQGISIGINRPGDGVNDKERFGGYGPGNNGRKNGPSRVLIGEEGTFEFNGRDGIMMGNNSELVTGQNSKVRFENRGRGVALDFGNESRVAFGKHSTNTFHSDGKGPRSGGGPSGSYDGYNYIGLNENGKILVDDFATFRVQMDNRGDNAWDDVISLGSQNGTKSEPLFQANKGSIVDIRDDNTNYYAELISVALGSSKNTVFQFNNPLYVSFMRYTNSQGLSAGEITGKLPLSIPQGNNPQDIGHGNILYISEKSQASRNRIEFNGPASRNGGSTVGTYTVYSMNKDGRDSQTKDKQSSVWTNIQGGSMPIAGFQSGRPDIQPANAASVRTGSSSGGVSATDRTYGIDPVGHNRQNIWVSNGSKINPTGVHKNIIKYVYEDGTPVKVDKDGNPVKDVIQSSDWNRTLDVSIDKEGFENILRNSSVRNGDEFLAAYSKAKYHISDIDGDNIADTGWKKDGTNSATYNYGTIASPKLKGYKPEILSTNVPGLEAGAKADSVSASYDSSKAPDTLIEAQAGKRTVSETYWRNIIAKSDLGTYETVVVYKRPMQSAIIKYIDTSANNKELAKDQVSGKSDEAINYSTDAKIADFVNKGYKLVDDGFKKASEDQKKFDDDENIDQEFVVRLEHDVTPVGPNNPHKPTDPINPKDPKSPKYPETDQWKKDVTSTVHYVVSDGKATAPADNVQNAQWTRTLNVDKVTGKVLNPNAPWTANKANYDAVPTPGLTGYYADKGSVASKTVTQENLEETVTYKPLGNLVPKPETPNDPNFPSKPGVKYPNDPTDPTKPGQPLVPDVPGYEPHLPDPKDPTKPGKSVPPGTPITPDKPGEDTPIIYVPKTTKVTKPTKQTVTFEGAGTATPADKVQDNFTFTGKQKNGTTTWDQPNHTYGKETVPVVKGYYADKKEAGSKTVTPDQPEVTDKVTYKPLGKIIPVDPEGNPIPKAPTPQYNNDPQDPTKGGKTPTPVIPGYVTDTPSVTPDKPGEDTKVVYRKAEQKAIIKYVDQNTGETLENDQVSGKSGEAIDYSTAAKIKKYQDRGYVLVRDEFPSGATYDTDPSVDQTWTVTLKHGETPVGPNNPHKPTEPINPNDPDGPKYPAENQWKKDVTSTVHYVVSDGKATAPADNVQNAQWTRTLNVDKVTGKVLNPNEPWTANKTNYDAVPTPGLTGYYADKGSVASKKVTQENLEETVTYRPLGKLVPKPETPNDPNFPSKPGVKYPNDPTDPTKPGQPVVPDVPGYEPHLPDPKDPTKPGKSVPPGTPITPDKPGEDTPIIYVPKTTKVTKPTKQTVTFEGAGTATPADKVQDNFTFTGKQKNGTTTWDQPNHTYGKETVPVVKGYYADKKEAGSKTVTPDQPEVTDKVTYKPLGKIIPVDPEGNPIPKAPTPQYNNDPQDPTKGGKTPTPVIPGYVTDTPSVTPDKPGEDTKVVYRKAEQKAIIKYVDQNTGETLENDQVSGKSGEAIDYSTAAKIKKYQDRGYVLVRDEFPSGATYDTDPSVDQTWTVTLKHGETPVGPNNPHKPTEPINPNDPDGPKYPAENQWKKDVTSTVHYVVSDGKATAPADNVQNAQWTRTLNVDKVTGKVLNPNEPWTANKTNYDAVPTPGLTGYYADKGSVASKKVTQENLEETVTYRPLGKLVPKPETPNDPNFPSKPGVKYPNDPTDPTKPGQPVVPDVPGYEPHLPDPKDPTKPGKSVPPGTPITPEKPGEDTPIIYVPKPTEVTKPTKQTVTFEGAGTATPADKVQDNFTFTGKQKNGTTTWDQPNHTYGKETVPVVTGYYADKKEAGSKTVTPDQPEVTDKVTYKALGKIIQVDEAGNVIPGSVSKIYENNPSNPTEAAETKIPDAPTGYKIKEKQPQAWGYNIVDKTIEPNDESDPDRISRDTPIIYVPIVNDVKKSTKQTVKFEGAGDKTPGDNVQDDFTFTGKENKASGTTTWNEKSHTYGKVSVPVIPGYYADKKEAGSKTVTPDQPEVTDKVTYKPLGKIIPVDPEGNKIPSAPTPQYNNDPQDPTKGGETPTPVIPGYVTDTPSVTPNKPGEDTPVVYRKAEQKAIIKYVDETTGQTLANDQIGGKSSEAINYSTADKIKYYEDRGYVLVKDEFPAGAHFDNDASVDQTWTVTLKHGETPVGPNDPHKPTDPINPTDPNSPKYPAEDQWKKDVTSTVKYVVSDGKATAPADNVQNAQWTRTLNLDKVTGKVLNPDAPWTANKANYDAVPTPGLTGYYADKASVASKTVTQENLEETVTYKPLGKLVPKPEKPNDPNFPSTPDVKYPNDPTDPTKPGQPVVPNVPGYKPYLPDPKDPSKPGKPVEPGKPITPEKPGDDTPIIYVPIVNDVKKPTKQTVKFEGAGDKTPGDNVQDDFTFTGKVNKADGSTTWNEKSHTYGKVSVPVIPGYYADKTEAGGKTVTPENPEATDTVTYKPLGKLVPKPEKPNDPNFPSTPEVKYPNDPTDPSKPGQPVVPNVPGYKPYLPDPKDPSKPGKPVEPGKPITPEKPGDDTPIIYVPIVNDVKKPTKQTVKFEGAGDKTPGDNVQDDFTFTGKENKADGTTTWNEKSHTYGKVSVPVIPGYYADKTEAGGKTVTPENPEATDTVTYKPLGKLVPKPEKPNDPNFPSTPEVKYPNDPTDPSKPGQPVVPNVPGYKPYLPDPKDPSKPGKPVEPGKPITPEKPGDDTPIIYVPIVNDVKKPTKQTVKFEGAGDKTPGDNVQDDFTFTGKVNKADGSTTWNEKSHTYGKVSVPVIPGYYADKTEAGGKTVTPENPEATDTVTYKPLGKLVPKPEKPNDPNFPSTPEVKYPNDPTDPTKPGQPVVPNVPGYKPYLPDPKDPSKPGKPVEPGKPITPEKPGDDTPIIYVPIVNDVKKPTKQTVKFEGAGDKTPGDNVQDDFTFTGKENKADGSTTWNEKSHTYGKVSVPVIPGYYADKTEAGGKTVTPENPEATDTVTYKPLGSLVPKSDDPKFPSTPNVKYPNDPTDPGKPGKPVVPDVPGYKPYLPDPKDPSKPGKPVEPGKELPNLPTNPGDDTPIVYVPIVNDVKKPTKQTVKFEGAGDKTPGDNVQDDFTFTGKENKADGTTTWNEKSHTYGKVSVPVIPGYYADKTEAGGKTVTPENPEATDTVTYKPLGSLVPKSDDPKFPSTPNVKYPNDPTDPGKPGKPVVPDVPGYKPYLPDPKDPSKPGKPVEPGKELPNLPTNPGDDTPIVYVPIVNDVKKPTKQTVKFEGAGDKTPGDNVQDDFTFTGKENKASGTTTWNEKSHTYGKVSVPVIPGYYADKTEAGGKTVTPENPEATDTVTYKPLGSLVPKSDDPKFPSTPNVKYPNDPTDPGKPGKPVVPDVPGYKPYLPDPKDPSKPGQPVEPGKELPNLPTNPGDDTPIIYVPIVPETPNVPTPEPRPETPGTPNPEPKPLNPEKVVRELPNTGTDSNAIMTGLGIIGMATTLLGLAQKKKED